MTLMLENKQNGVLRVKVNIWVPSQQAYVKAIVIFDTGAYKTILDERLADLLQISRTTGSATSVTAAGTITTQNGTLPKMQLGTKTLNDIPVNILRLPDELETYCILGMNVLREFDINVSNYSGTVTLTPMPLPAKYHIDNYSITLAIIELEA